MISTRRGRNAQALGEGTMLNEQEKIECKQNRLEMLKDIRTLTVVKNRKFDIKTARRMCSAHAVNNALGTEVKDSDLYYQKYRDKLLRVWFEAL